MARIFAEQQEQIGFCNIIYLPGVCLLHQYHLICQSGLSYVDSCLSSTSFFSSGENDLKKYFASLAALANTWREKASSIIAEWERQFGPSKQGRQFPQHVLQGRWGSVDAAEAFYLARGREKIQSVLLRVIAGHIKADKSVDSVQKGDPENAGGTTQLCPDEDSVSAYKIKLSKWYSSSFKALNSKIFWFLLSINHKIREPLRHFLHFTQKYSSPKNSEHIVLLLVESIEKFQREWVVLALHASTWVQRALEESKCTELSATVQGKLKVLACRLLLKTGNAFDQRILQRLTQYLGFIYNSSNRSNQQPN